MAYTTMIQRINYKAEPILLINIHRSEVMANELYNEINRILNDIQ